MCLKTVLALASMRACTCHSCPYPSTTTLVSVRYCNLRMDRRWVSLLGACMSVMYSMIAFIASAVKGHSGVSYGKRSGSVADRTFGTFNSLGTVMFAFGGQVVMPEIQVTCTWIEV